MGANQNSLIEAQLRKAVQRAVKKAFKHFENEPTLVIEFDDNESGNQEDPMTDIRTWLFRRE